MPGRRIFSRRIALKQIAFIAPHTEYFGWFQLLYEVSYGIDFVTIELFFRGFLILRLPVMPDRRRFCRWRFYCGVHFGKPLLECILPSSAV